MALGAAVQADILVPGRREMLLLAVTPLSLGIETMGGPARFRRPISHAVGALDAFVHGRMLASIVLNSAHPAHAPHPTLSRRWSVCRIY